MQLTLKREKGRDLVLKTVDNGVLLVHNLQQIRLLRANGHVA